MGINLDDEQIEGLGGGLVCGCRCGLDKGRFLYTKGGGQKSKMSTNRTVSMCRGATEEGSFWRRAAAVDWHRWEGDEG